MKNNSEYETMKLIITNVKKDGNLTEKFKVFLSGMLLQAVADKKISFKEAKELDRFAEIDRNKILGVEELTIYGNVTDNVESPLEF